MKVLSAKNYRRKLSECKAYRYVFKQNVSLCNQQLVANAYMAGYEAAKKDALKVVAKNVQSAESGYDESKRLFDYRYWDGAYDIATAIQREIRKNK